MLRPGSPACQARPRGTGPAAGSLGCVPLQARDGHPFQKVHHQQAAGHHARHAARHLNPVVELLQWGWQRGSAMEWGWGLGE